MNGKKIIFKLDNEGEVVPVSIDFATELPLRNPKCTSRNVTAYVGLALKEYENKNGNGKKVFLVALKDYRVQWKTENSVSGVLPEGAIIQVSYSTGTWKHRLHSYVKWFVVKKGTKGTIMFKDEKGDEDVKAEVKNLETLEIPAEDKVMKAKAKIANKGWKESYYDPVALLYALFCPKVV